jgi:hypothetical protein
MFELYQMFGGVRTMQETTQETVHEHVLRYCYSLLKVASVRGEMIVLLADLLREKDARSYYEFLGNEIINECAKALNMLGDFDHHLTDDFDKNKGNLAALGR